MKPRSIDSDAELLAAMLLPGEEYGDSDAPPPPPGTPVADDAPAWHPDLNPTQKLIFDDPTKFILGYGEKGSGKTIGFCHKMVRHAYENQNALVIIITSTIRTGDAGIWHDLDTMVLPAWKEGMGLEYTASKLDNLTKDRHRWIRNRFGGWSKIMLMSVLYGKMIEDRVKGPTPSYVHIEEITNCDTDDYFKWPAGQIGRRAGIDGPQQLTASCNPKGPSHWVYKVWWLNCIDEKTGNRKPAFAVYHVPIHENKHRLPEGYVEGLYDIFDEIERRRLVDGEWIDRPPGDGLFVDYYKPEIHVRGDAKNGQGLRPFAGMAIVSYDIGPMWPSITFEQQVRFKDKLVWIIFDEIDVHGSKTLYKNLAKQVVVKMKFWNTLTKASGGGALEFMHITDESAINQWRAGGEGSYDAWEFEKEYRKVAFELASGDEERGLRQMKLIGCPKGPGSVEARVRMLQTMLFMEELFVSDICKNTKDMLTNLTADPKAVDEQKPVRGPHIHKFDSVTYGIFKMAMGGRNNLPSGKVAPSLLRCGST